MMLKLKLQYFGHLMRRIDSLEKTLMLGGIGVRRKRGWQRKVAGWHHWLNGRESEWTPGDFDGLGGLAWCDSWGHKESDMTEWLNWTELNILKPRDNECLFLMAMFILNYANVLCIYPKLCLQVGSAFWLRTYLINQYVILRYCSCNLCKWNYLYGDLPFFKIPVNHCMAQDEPFGAKIIPKCILWVRGLVPFWVLRHSFLSLTDC